MARASMSALITRTRELISDPAGASQVWTDDQIQNVLDTSRQDMRYMRLVPAPDWSTGAIQFLDYYAPIGDWETDWSFAQYYTHVVTPSVTEPIPGRVTFAASTFPPVYIAFGKTYDLYKAAADLLERQASQWLMAYNVMVDGQKLERSQVAAAMREQAKQYRMQQRVRTARLTRPDFAIGADESVSLRAKTVDYITTG